MQCDVVKRGKQSTMPENGIVGQEALRQMVRGRRRDNILVREGVGQVGKWPNGVITGPLNLTAMHQKIPNIPPEGGSQAYC